MGLGMRYEQQNRAVGRGQGLKKEAERGLGCCCRELGRG